MKFLLPPSRDRLLRNARLLAADWAAGSVLTRYFMASQLLSGLLLGACSLASLVAGAAGLPGLYLGLMGAAATCLVHTVATWHVLKRRCGVRYEVW
jgi:hypothetical protein